MPYTPIEDADVSKSTNRFSSNTTYDNAGNVTQDLKFRISNFWYDANGRMFKASKTDNSSQANSVYDASGKRVAEQIDGVWSFFIYDAMGKLVSEYGGLAAMDEGGVKYVLQDWQGSSRAILSNTGSVTARMDYTAFGEEIGSGVGQRTTAQGFGATNNLSQKYALTERDKATGLDHTWFRKNENRAGRWTSPDPYNGSMSLGNPQSFNRYAYVGNDPINFVDPSGLDDDPLGIVTIRWVDEEVEAMQSLWSLWLGGQSQIAISPMGGGNPSVGGGLTGGGGTEPQQSNTNNNKKHCKQASGNPNNPTYGKDRPAIEDKLKPFVDAGLISNITQTREGVIFNINDRAGFLGALYANNNFRHDTPLGLEHTGDVRTNIVHIHDFRSYTTGSNTLGPDSVSGRTRSLQVDVGRTRNGVTLGYADLDCSNPAQDVWSAIKHIFGK